MRGVRGGFKDQLKAFFEFLIREKKKKKKKEQLLRLKKKKEDEQKKQSFFDYNKIVSDRLDMIVSDIYENNDLDYAKINDELDLMKKDKNNYSLLDKIEEVSEKVEVEVLFEEIVKDDIVIVSSRDVKKNMEKKQKFDRLIFLSTQNINKSDNIVEINHYYDRISSLYDKHVNVEKKFIDKSDKVLDNSINLIDYIAEEEKLLLLVDNKLKTVDKNKDILFDNENDLLIQNDVTGDVVENFLMDSDKFELNSDESFLFDEFTEYNIYNDFEECNVNTEYFIDDNSFSENEKKQDFLIDVSSYSEETIVEDISNDDKKNVDLEQNEFDVVRQVNIAQIIISENLVRKIRENIVVTNDEINKLDMQVERIDDLFKENNLVDKIINFGYNFLKLSRGLIGKYFFNNKLLGRLNNEMLINNSLKGIHRIFVDDRKEVPYVVFKSFEDEISSKRDCVAKIYDICVDSLQEINNLRRDFLKRYGNVDTDEVSNFLKKIDEYEKQLMFRKEEIKRIQKKVEQKYEKNKRLVKIKN